MDQPVMGEQKCRITLDVTMDKFGQRNPDQVGEALFDFLCSDPDDLFPEIQVVEGFDVEPA